jgi:YhcH/YjgK/YiaL family protein
MIIDTLSNASRYLSLHPRFAQAFEYLAAQNLESLEPGKFELDGKDLHASVSDKAGVAAADAKFEAHNQYIDIQVCIRGEETMGWKPRSLCSEIKSDYNEEKDVIFYNDRPTTYFQLHAGQFVIFYPEDVHAPMIGEGPIKKLVIKVKR